MNKELLEKYIVGETNEVENTMIKNWLEEDANNKEEYIKMKKMWDS